MLCWIILQQILRIAILEGGAGYHFRIQECPAAELPEEYTIVTIGPIHHRGYAKNVV
jgi:hypothetical protein